MSKGEIGNDGGNMVLPLHLGDGLDNWGCEIGSKPSSDGSSSESESSESESSNSDSSESESSNSESSISESSSDENTSGNMGKTTTGNDAYTSFVLELQHSMTFGRSSKAFSYAERMLRTELDSDNDSFVDGCTILIDSGGPDRDEVEKNGVQQLDDISLADTDDDDVDDHSCESDDPHCDNLKGASKTNYMDGASYFWRRRQYVMRRRRILMILAILSLSFLLLLVMKIAVGISSSIATFDGLRIHHHAFDGNSGVDFDTVELNTVWDVDTPDMGV
eukprot:CAMPEP_0168180438 /NCGR_PEP_ID=MMETSP0139_2-20121125/10530_1 /TAXON_ID=44445 /ORGANISM="Pseudo-nitzschia australis, Strain 10249 10 AB" /LENGTH=276 /DNA_ID=CAMNT_0008100641 /DNA_START=337 /DNA_END=1167 /DNA_ORIENTATION=-